MKNDRKFKVWYRELNALSGSNLEKYSFEKVVYLWSMGFGPRFSLACLREETSK